MGNKHRGFQPEYEVSKNVFGEFIYITIGKSINHHKLYLTFWGTGFHNYQERWAIEEWVWHQSPSNAAGKDHPLSIEEAENRIKQRLADITKSLNTNPISANLLFTQLGYPAINMANSCL